MIVKKMMEKGWINSLLQKLNHVEGLIHPTLTKF
jgi:hypothetical protein